MYSALGPVWVETRAQSDDWYGSGTLHPGQVLGVVCHYFPPLLDVPTFATRCLHVRHEARDPSGGRWNCGRECCPVILPKSDIIHLCWFSPFISAEALRASDISPVPSLNLQPNTRGGTAKKITGSTYRKFVGATQKKKIKLATKSKTIRFASNALLGPSKRQKRRVCRNLTPSDIASDSDTDLAVPFDDNSTEEKQDADFVYCTGRFSEDHKGEESIRCAKYFGWAYTLCADMEEDLICEPCQG